MLLEGNLGSGKTTFMQAFGHALGIKTPIASPTFTLIDEYIEGRLPMYHIDLYRLEPSQVPSLHLQEYWRGEDFPLGVVAIEWSSKLHSPPLNFLQINLSVPMRSSIPESSQNFEDNFLEDFPEERIIQLIAQGSHHAQILKRFQS
jgi:tRNA threonylcarbamoyl adenosine modification protein YjeE